MEGLKRWEHLLRLNFSQIKRVSDVFLRFIRENSRKFEDFYAPVDKSMYDSYLDFVPREMNLQTIERKLSSEDPDDQYLNAESVLYDVESIYSNAALFNLEGSEIMKTAELLDDSLKKGIKEAAAQSAPLESQKELFVQLFLRNENPKTQVDSNSFSKRYQTSQGVLSPNQPFRRAVEDMTFTMTPGTNNFGIQLKSSIEPSYYSQNYSDFPQMASGGLEKSKRPFAHEQQYAQNDSGHPGFGERGSLQPAEGFREPLRAFESMRDPFTNGESSEENAEHVKITRSSKRQSSF